MKDSFDFDDNSEDSLVDHFDSDFLDVMPNEDVIELDFDDMRSN